MAEPESAVTVVSDAGPLIHLDQLGSIDLLRDFRQVIVPNAVRAEVARHRPSALRRRSVRLTPAAMVPEPEPRLLELTQAFLLGAGEFEALRLMQDLPHAILLTDDAAARLVAVRLAHEVHGTVGIIVRALRRGQRTKRQVLNLLRAVPSRSSLFIEARLLEQIVREVTES